MIDTKELRRLAQEATPGPWVSQGRYIGTPRHMSYVGEVRDQCGNWSDTEKSRADAAFISAANPAAISELLDRLEAAEKERDVLRDRLALESQENGALHEAVDRACDERDALRAKIEQMERQEPCSYIYEYANPIDGSPVWRDTPGYWNAQYPRSSKPLYALPGAQGESE